MGSTLYIIQSWEQLPDWDTMEYPCQTFSTNISSPSKDGSVYKCEEMNRCVRGYMHGWLISLSSQKGCTLLIFMEINISILSNSAEFHSLHPPKLSPRVPCCLLKAITLLFHILLCNQLIISTPAGHLLHKSFI